MISSTPYTEIALPDNRTVKVYDHSHVYFGDYYHVRLEIRCEFAPLDQSGQGEAVVYQRFLERMAVPSAAVEDVRLALLEEFKQNALPYLATSDFPAKFIAKSTTVQPMVKKRYTSGS